MPAVRTVSIVPDPKQQVLECLAGEPEPVRIARLATLTGFGEDKVRRILTGLLKQNHVVHPDRYSWALSPEGKQLLTGK